MTVITRSWTTGAWGLALALVLATGTMAFGPSAQAQQHQQQTQQAPAQQGMPMQSGMMQHMAAMMAHHGMGQGQPMQPGMMGEGMAPDMMGQGVGPGMMGQGMGPGMMGQGMEPGMMGQGMGSGMGGWSRLEGRRVVPTMQLSTDDVRRFLERHLTALGNERLKVGNVEAMDDDTITADIVTVDDSLVESFEVDRHTGLIARAG